MSTLWSGIPPASSSDQNKRSVAAATNNKNTRKRQMSENTCASGEPTTVDNNSIVEGEVTSVKGDDVKFRFQLAHAVSGLDHVDVSFEGAQIRRLWENFHQRNGSQESEITQQEMERFHSALRSHVRNTIKLRLHDRSIFILTQVWLPIFSVSSKGHIRIEKGCDRVKSILRELTNLCQGSTLTANPRISASENVVEPEYE